MQDAVASPKLAASASRCAARREAIRRTPGEVVVRYPHAACRRRRPLALMRTGAPMTPCDPRASRFGRLSIARRRSRASYSPAHAVFAHTPLRLDLVAHRRDRRRRSAPTNDDARLPRTRARERRALGEEAVARMYSVGAAVVLAAASRTRVGVERYDSAAGGRTDQHRGVVHRVEMQRGACVGFRIHTRAARCPIRAAARRDNAARRSRRGWRSESS